MSVSVSQIGIGRSHDRSIDQSQFPGQFLDQSICVCRCLYKEQHPPTRSHFYRKILRLVDLFSISSLHIPSTSRAPIPPVDEVAASFARRAIAPRGLPRRFSNGCFVLSIAPARHETLDESSPDTQENSMLGGRKVAVEKVRTKCRGTRRRRPRKWDRKKDDAPTTDLGSSNEANALC